MIELEHEADKQSGCETDFDAAGGSPNGDSLRTAFLDKQIEEKRRKENPFSGTLGMFILICGILLPTLAITCAITANVYSVCGVLWRHWLETLVQFGLIVSIPFGLWFAWTRICRNDMRRARLTGQVIGVSLGSALLAAIITTAATVMRYPTVDFAGYEHTTEMAGLAVISWTAVLAALCAGIRFRSLWPTAGAKSSSALYILLGAGLSFLALGASETKSACVRIAEKLAITGSADQQKNSLNFLRSLNCERDLKFDCSTPRAFDLTGMFLRLDNEQNRKMYFLATGQPYRLDSLDKADFAALPDEMLGRNVVGEKVSDLSMHRSLISGMFHPESLTSTIDWTFVFKNTGSDAKEARAEIGLPKDAVISEMVLWINGVPKRATIASTEKATSAYRWVVGGRRDPALVTDLGKGRVLIQCYPVAAQSEVRIKISMKSSMKLDKAGEAVASLPTLFKSNFEVEGDHRVHLRADRKLMLDLDNVRHVVANNGLHQVSGTLASANRSRENIDVRVHRAANLVPVAIKDPFDKRGYIIQQYLPTPAKKPDHLVVVVDGSAAVESHKIEIANQLAKIPSAMPTSLVVASDEFKDGMQFDSKEKAIEAMRKMDFKGGQENLGSVIKASELAGETEGGAVLWIHGPQPALDKELYIIAPYLVKPNFYELSIEDSVTDVNEFFKNHQEIGPFTAVARNSSFEKDLGRFLSRWQADGVDYTLKYARSYEKPAVVDQSIYVQDEISRLYTAQRVRELVAQGKRWEAGNLAVSYQIVTPVTSAVVLENAADYARFGLSEAPATDGSDSVLAKTQAPERGHSGGGFRQFEEQPNVASSSNTGAQSSWRVASTDDRSSGSPVPARESVAVDYGQANYGQSAMNLNANEQSVVMQGATNGTISPQEADARSIMGVNTAGTVRVNNLANLEALLQAFGVAMQFGGLLVGGALLIISLSKPFPLVTNASFGISRSALFILGGLTLLAGLAMPGFLNFMVASARDANLFS
jgi:hypothetical protein